jgi:acetylornithine/N-succinyldiaminopimelate aminotransferase
VNRARVIEAAAQYEVPAYARADVVLVRGEGARVFDADGRAYLDLYGGHAVSLLGHSPARVVEAIVDQASALPYYSNLVHLPARARAAERLCRLAPWPDAKVFFANSGAEANETALKIARRATGRTRVVAFRGGFHGRTLGALAVTALGRYREQAAALLDEEAFVFAEFDDAEGLARAIDARTAAVLVEPIQSMAGVRVPSAEFVRALRRRCDETGACLVFDEIQTAPARTGTWFAGEAWGVAPDLLTTAKAIAGGFPASAVLMRGDVAATVRPGDQGTTFGGGPVACAAMDAALAMLQEMDAPSRARALEARFRAGLSGASGMETLRGRGGLLGVVVRGDAAEAREALRRKHRVLAGECPGDPRVLRLFPPLVLSDAEIDEAVEALGAVLR